MSGFGGKFDRTADKVHYGLKTAARLKDRRHSHLLELLGVIFRDDATHHKQSVCQPEFAH